MMDESDAITKELLLSKFVSYKEKFPEMAEAAIISAKEAKERQIWEKPKPKFDSPDVKEVGQLDMGFNPFKLDEIPKEIHPSISAFLKQK